MVTPVWKLNVPRGSYVDELITPPMFPLIKYIWKSITTAESLLGRFHVSLTFYIGNESVFVKDGIANLIQRPIIR